MMKEMLDNELEVALSRKLKEYKQSYKWLFIVLCFDLGLSFFYFVLNKFAGSSGQWVFEYYRFFNTVFVLAKLPIFIIAMVKVKPVAGKIVLLATLLIGVYYVVQDWWDYFNPTNSFQF